MAALVAAMQTAACGLSPVAVSRGSSRRSAWTSLGVACCRVWAVGAQAQLYRSMRDLPRPEVEPQSPALAGEFLTTGPPGKSPTSSFYISLFLMLIQEILMARRMEICQSQGRVVIITWLSKGAIVGIIDLHEGNFILY